MGAEFNTAQFVPIASLRADVFGAENNIAIQGEVVLVWPYSSITESTALLVAEVDSRLRDCKGQVRLQFRSHAAEAIRSSALSIGDLIQVCLRRASWIESSVTVRTPGRSVDGELLFSHHLQLKKYGGAEKPVDINIHEPEDPHISLSLPSLEQPPVAWATPPRRRHPSPNTWSSPGIPKLPLSVAKLSPFTEAFGHDAILDDGSVPGVGRKRLKFDRLSGSRWKFDTGLGEIQAPENIGKAALQNSDDQEVDWTAVDAYSLTPAVEVAERTPLNALEENSKPRSLQIDQGAAPGTAEEPMSSMEIIGANRDDFAPTLRATMGPPAAPSLSKALAQQPISQQLDYFNTEIYSTPKPPRLDPVMSPGLPMVSPFPATPVGEWRGFTAAWQPEAVPALQYPQVPPMQARQSPDPFQAPLDPVETLLEHFQTTNGIVTHEMQLDTNGSLVSSDPPNVGLGQEGPGVQSDVQTRDKSSIVGEPFLKQSDRRDEVLSTSASNLDQEQTLGSQTQSATMAAQDASKQGEQTSAALSEHTSPIMANETQPRFTQAIDNFSVRQSENNINGSQSHVIAASGLDLDSTATPSDMLISNFSQAGLETEPITQPSLFEEADFSTTLDTNIFKQLSQGTDSRRPQLQDSHDSDGVPQGQPEDFSYAPISSGNVPVEAMRGLSPSRINPEIIAKGVSISDETLPTAYEFAEFPPDRTDGSEETSVQLIKPDRSHSQEGDVGDLNIAVHFKGVEAPEVLATPSLERSGSGGAPSTRKSSSKRKAGGKSIIPPSLQQWFSSRTGRRLTDAAKGQDAEQQSVVQPTEVESENFNIAFDASQGFRTVSSYYTPLANAHSHLNLPSTSSESMLDFLAVVAQAPSKPKRADSGPRHYYTIFYVQDPASERIEARCFRSQSKLLPKASAGDVVLLRDFTVKSHQHVAYLQSTQSSSWCVWHLEKAISHGNGTSGASRLPIEAVAKARECRGAPVEVGEMEEARVVELKMWWDATLTQANEKDDKT